MFGNISDNIIWDNTRQSVKTLDIDTPQLNGKGQTQRYFEIFGSLLHDHYRLIEQLYTLGDADTANEMTIDKELYSMGLKFLPSNLPLIKKRHLAKYYPYMSTLIGTRVFVDWLLWMVLQWRVVSSAKQTATNLLGTYDDVVPPTNVPYIYDPVQGEVQFVLYDQNAVWTLIILVDQGSTDPRAFQWVQDNMGDWILSNQLQFT